MMKRNSYDDFDATELYCPQCRRSVPVRKHLLLVLPQGDKYEYRCAYCGCSVGEKQESGDDGAPKILLAR
ncbi:MAG TPA: cytoplasmic protein [Deltaproteobacteria bacterium]|nr:cytoplasmic protein [Deltaproteobacteria bacterium]